MAGSKRMPPAFGGKPPRVTSAKQAVAMALAEAGEPKKQARAEARPKPPKAAKMAPPPSKGETRRAKMSASLGAFGRGGKG